MDTNELRKQTKEKLVERLQDKKEELGNIQFEVLTGKDTNVTSMKYIKKEIAKIMTILKEESFSLDAKKVVKDTSKKTKVKK